MRTVFLLVLLLFLVSADSVVVPVYRMCPLCQGKGHTTCVCCGGSGKIKVHESFAGGNKICRVDKCPRCDGTGTLYKCFYCGGSGKIKVDSLVVRE